MIHSSRKNLLCLGGLVGKLLQCLIYTPINPQKHSKLITRQAEKIRKRVHSPSQLPFPYWKLFLQGKWLYQRGQFLQAVSCFTCAAEFELSEAYAWLSMIYLGGRETIQQDTALAFAYAKKAEQLCPEKKRIFSCIHFQREVLYSTLVRFHELEGYKDAEITFIPPRGVDPDTLQVSVTKNGIIQILAGQSCFRKYEGKTQEQVLKIGIYFNQTKNFKEAWICFYLLTKLNFMLGFGWIGDMYRYGCEVPLCLQTAKSCFLKMVLTDHERVHGEAEESIAKIMWRQSKFDEAEWFYILSTFHGSSILEELIVKRYERTPKINQLQATIELERARSWVICSDYQKAEWHYLLAVFYGSRVAFTEFNSLRDLINQLQKE
jgi:hypothetical protein